jgi:cysteine synthase A
VTVPERTTSRAWVNEAIARIAADANRSADTHLHQFPLPETWGVDLYLKDEAVHPTGSLKHRLARSLFLYSLCSGWIGPGTPIIEASSGSTAVSEAYFARMLELPFVAVMPRGTSPEKCRLIEHVGGTCHFVDDPTEIYQEARRLANSLDGHYMDQFTYAERATDWRGNNNIAESIFQQMSQERYPEPRWIVVGAGTGGTSATIGRYVRYQQHTTNVLVVDPEGSAFLTGWRNGDTSHRTGRASRIEGIGRPQVEPSFVPSVVDRMMFVPDAASIAAMRHLRESVGLFAGASTGTSLWGALSLVAELRSRSLTGSIVTLICDGGERYLDSYYDDAWLANNEIHIGPYEEQLREFSRTGAWSSREDSDAALSRR